MFMQCLQVKISHDFYRMKKTNKYRLLFVRVSFLCDNIKYQIYFKRNFGLFISAFPKLILIAYPLEIDNDRHGPLKYIIYSMRVLTLRSPGKEMLVYIGWHDSCVAKMLFNTGSGVDAGKKNLGGSSLKFRRPALYTFYIKCNQ